MTTVLRYPLLIGSLTFACFCSMAEEKVDLTGLPPAVLKTAKEVVGDSKVEEVEDRVEDGKRAYEVEFERDGKKMAILISAEGKLIETEYRMSVGDTPEKIREAVAKQFPGASISHIKKVEKAGAVLFEISIRVEGKALQVKMDDAGRVSQPDKK